MEENDVYLGDGLYAVFDGWQIELYASNGRIKTNRVYLDPYVLKAFERYVAELNARLQTIRGLEKKEEGHGNEGQVV